MNLLDRVRLNLALKLIPERNGTNGTREKANRAWPMILSDVVGQDEIPKIEDFEQYAELYRINPWSYAATFWIASSASGIPWRLYRRTGDGKREIEEQHWLARLFKFPNPRQPFSRILFATFGYLELAGNAFWALEKEQSSTPNEIWVLRPDRVSALPDPEEMIAGYRYKVGLQSVDYEPEEIVHFDYWNPVDEIHGQGSITAARNAHISDIHASEWNKRVFRKGTHGTAIIAKEEMEKPQITRLKETVKQQLIGDENYGNVEVFWGVDFKPIGMTAKDAEFLGLKKQDMLEILAAHGVPPSVVGAVEAANYATMKEQVKLAWNNQMPKIVGVRDTINTQWLRRIDERLEIDFDLSNVEALQEDRTARITRQTTLLTHGLRSRNELRQEDGQDPVEDSEGDTYYMPIGAIPVGSAGMGSRETDEDEEDDDEETRALRKIAKKAAKAEEPKLAALPSVRSESKILEKRTRAVRLKAAVAGARQIVDVVNGAERSAGGGVLKEDEPYDIMSDPVAVRRLREEGARKARFVTENMRSRMAQELGDGIEAGLSLSDLSDLVDEVTEELERGKFWALRIARTEVRQAQNFGADQAMRALEVEKKVWISAGDESTRELHLATDLASHDEPVKVGEDFQPIGAEYPGSSGRAEDDINCRCDSAPFIEGLSDKALKDFEGAFVKARNSSVARLEGEWVSPLHKYLREYAERVKRSLRS